MRGPQQYHSMADAVAAIPSGASIMIPGFGPGTPWNLLRALYETDKGEFTFISNAVGLGGIPGLIHASDFVRDGRVKHVIASFTAATHPSEISECEKAVRSGAITAEIVPQGTLAERIRAAGAGIPAFYTPAGVGTRIADGKEQRTFRGRPYLMEEALDADYTFVRAYRADEAGNLVFRLTGRNFNPIMAMAARHTIVEVEEPIDPAGSLSPDEIHLPGVYIESIVKIAADGIRGVNMLAMRAAAVRAEQEKRA